MKSKAAVKKILTPENAALILKWQDLLPIEKMNTRLVSDCIKVIEDDLRSKLSKDDMARIWRNVAWRIAQKSGEWPSYVQECARFRIQSWDDAKFKETPYT